MSKHMYWTKLAWKCEILRSILEHPGFDSRNVLQTRIEERSSVHAQVSDREFWPAFKRNKPGLVEGLRMAKSITSEQAVKGAVVDPAELKGRRFGRVLTKLGKVTREQVHEALTVQKARKDKGQTKRLGELLVEMGYITQSDVLEALAGQAGMRMVQVEADDIPQTAFDALPAETAQT